MADDLKQTLNKVLHSKGNSHFFFMYGTGKRKDGAGDGALAVGAQKLKKETVEQACECKEFFEGVCWGSSDGGIVYFQGKSKKLSTMLVSKMMLSVKKATGHPFEFALPTAEEEERAAKLAPAPQEGKDVPPETTAPQPTGKGAPPVAPQLPDADAVLFKQRLHDLTPAFIRAIQLNPASKANLAQLSAAATAAAKAAASKEGTYQAALAALDKFEAAVKEAIAQADAAGTKSPLKVAEKIIFQQSRLAWDAARKATFSSIDHLKKSIIEDRKSDPRIAEITSKVNKLDEILLQLDESLGNKLDDAYQAPTDEKRQELHHEASVILQRYRHYVESDPLVHELDNNGFIPLSIYADLTKTLTLLDSKLNAH